MSNGILNQMVCSDSVNSLTLILKQKIIVCALEVKFLNKLSQLVTLQICQRSYLSFGESPNHTMLSHYHETHIKHIFQTLHLSNQIWFLFTAIFLAGHVKILGPSMWFDAVWNNRCCGDGLVTKLLQIVSWTHLPLDKMAAILADDISKCTFLNENDKILTQISLKLDPRSPIDNKPALVQVMAWRRTGDKPLPEPMMTKFTDAQMRH